MKPKQQRTQKVVSPKPAKGRPGLPAWKKLVFGAVACLSFFILAELVLALAGFKPLLYERDPYVGFSSRIPLFVRDSTSNNPDALVTAKNKQTFFNVQRFTAKKPKGAYRIFCLGGSTTFGHPYEDPTSFAGWLRSMLPTADPSRSWEVINCGGISYASYREALLMEELVEYEPDLFIVLSGQNEFLEQRTYGDIRSMPATLQGAGALLSHTRIHAAAKAVVDRVRGSAVPAGASNTLPAEVETLLERVVGPQAYQRDETLQKQVIEHYRFNLARMVDIAASAGAQVIFINPASNLRHCAPFKSEHRAGLTEAELKRWEAFVEQARRSSGESGPQGFQKALDALDQAALIDDRFAGLHYVRGQALWNLQRFTEARSAFVRARDEDVCPLRALTPMLDIVSEVAAGRDAPLVDFVKFLDRNAEHGVPGDDWFLDHVHPTIEGNRQIALALLDAMSARGIVRLAPTWNEARASEIKRAVERQITPAQHGAALCTLAKVLAWAGKHDEAYRVSVRATELAPKDPEAYFAAGKNAMHLRRPEEASVHLRKALEVRPGFVEAQALLGNVLAQQGQWEEAFGHLRTALARRPGDPELHCMAGSLSEKRGAKSDAAASFREAIRLSPNYAEAHNNLAWLLKDFGQLDEALVHFREALRFKPGLSSPAIGLSWLLAVHPDARARDPKLAIQLGEKQSALSQYRDWMSLDALAAAYAADGRFDDAIRTSEKALALLQPAGRPEASAVAERLKLYRARQPFHETTRPAP